MEDLGRRKAGGRQECLPHEACSEKGSVRLFAGVGDADGFQRAAYRGGLEAVLGHELAQ